MTNQPGRPPVPPLPAGIPPLPPSLGAEDRAELSAPAEPPHPASHPGLPPTPPMPGTPVASREAPDAVARAATLPAPSAPPAAGAPAAGFSAFPSSSPTFLPASSAPPTHPAPVQEPMPPRHQPQVVRATPRTHPARPARPSTSGSRSRPPRLLAVLALAAGVLALIGSFIPFVNEGAWLLGVVAVVLGVLVLVRRLPGRAFAATGIVAGGLALLVSAVMLLVFSTGLLGQFGPGAGSPGAESTAPEAAPGDVVPALFGQTVTYDDGLQVQVSAPSAYIPSSDPPGIEPAAAVVVTVTVYNGTADPFQPAFSSRVTAAGQDATPVDDPSNAVLGAPPTAEVPPGEAVSWQEAYSVASGADAVPADFAYEVAPTPDYFAARFSN